MKLELTLKKEACYTTRAMRGVMTDEYGNEYPFEAYTDRSGAWFHAETQEAICDSWTAAMDGAYKTGRGRSAAGLKAFSAYETRKVKRMSVVTVLDGTLLRDTYEEKMSDCWLLCAHYQNGLSSALGVEPRSAAWQEVLCEVAKHGSSCWEVGL